MKHMKSRLIITLKKGRTRDNAFLVLILPEFFLSPI
jgi:hypothetical protein